MRIFNRIVKKVKQPLKFAALALAGVAAALETPSASGQAAQDPPMYGANLILNNQVFTNGVVTLGSSNYDAKGGWISFPNAGNVGAMGRATNLTIELLSAPAQYVTNTNGINVFTNSFNSTNNVPLIVTWQLVMDDYTSLYSLSTNYTWFGVAQTNPIPATWTNVTVTNIFNINSNRTWQLVGTNTALSNFYGCKKGRIVQLQYMGTNDVAIYFLRAGFIMGP
jgi:hypothetical protein